MKIDETNIDEVFTYHAPSPDQVVRYEKLRAAAKEFASAILQNVIPSAERTRALNNVSDTLMLANKAIALEHIL